MARSKPNLNNNPAGVHCQICYRTDDLNEEHIVPEWLRKYTTTSDPFLPQRGHADQPPALKILICRHHNDTMSRIFENKVATLFKEMSSGAELSLSGADQRVLLSWAMKTELLFDLHSLNQFATGRASVHTLRNSRRDATQEMQELLERGGSPRSGWVMRVGFIPDEPPVQMSWSTQPPFVPQKFRSFSIKSGVSSWGRLTFETVMLTPLQAAEYVAAVGEDPRFLVVSADTESSVLWPPRVKLARSDDFRLREEWGHASIQGWYRLQRSEGGAWARSPEESKRKAQRQRTPIVIRGVDGVRVIDDPALLAEYHDYIALLLAEEERRPRGSDSD